MQLYEKYRPKVLSEFIGQPKIITTIKRITARPEWDRDAFWIQGPSGTGKSPQAYIRLVQDCHNNMGAVLQRIEQGEMLI